MRIGMIGAGYVGLTTGACFAQLGHRVRCIDIDAHRIEALKRGIVPIYEPGLDEIVQEHMRSGHLDFSDVIAESCADCDVIFLAVGTPSRPDGAINLGFIESAAR